MFELKKIYPDIKIYSDAWTNRVAGRIWMFETRGLFNQFKWSGEATDAYHARIQGWEAWAEWMKSKQNG